MPADPGGKARERVLHQLKSRGPRSAAEIAQVLGVTAVAVRQQLAALAAEGLVESSDERRRVGRPRRIWRLAPAAQSLFPDTHGELTVDLISAVRATFGDEGLDRLVSVRTRRQLESYRERMPAGRAPLEKRVAALAEIRRREGYMAEWRRAGDGFLLVENHCPICAAARACQGLCRSELELFSRVLGEDASVERGDWLLAGARRCAYRIVPRATRPASTR
jgi:predicted ArsR family transcriptional regulator